jgi:hypothetical protein
LGFAGENPVIIRRLIVPLALATVSLLAGQAFAQGTFPAPLPLPGQVEAPASNASPFSPVNGAGPSPLAVPSEACTNGFAPLRQDAEKRGKLIKEASERHAPSVEACKLIASFGQAEIKMIKYVDANSANCGIPPQISEQLKTAHKNTEAMLQKVCAVVQQTQEQREPAGPVGDFPPYNYQ